MKSIRILCAVFALSITTVAPAGAVIPVFDASNFAKNAITAAQTVKMAMQQAQQLQAQLQALAQQGQQLLIEQRNIQTLPAPVWSAVQQNLARLTALLNEDHVLSITANNLDQQFAQLFPGYIPPANYAQLYGLWDANTRTAALQAMQAAGAIVSEQGGDIQTLLANEQEINNPTGQMSVLQAAASIAAQQVEQLQKLLTLDAYRTQAERAYALQQQAVRAAQEAQNEAFQAWLQGSTQGTTW